MVQDWPKIRIVNETAAGRNTRVYLNDIDISEWCSAATLHYQCTEVNSLTLDLYVSSFEADGRVQVQLKPGTEGLLKMLGWTPPQEHTP